jgi:hypothetical protein
VLVEELQEGAGHTAGFFYGEEVSGVLEPHEFGAGDRGSPSARARSAA